MRLVKLLIWKGLVPLMVTESYKLCFSRQYKIKNHEKPKIRTGYLTSEELDDSEILWFNHEQGLIMFESNCNCEKLKHLS